MPARQRINEATTDPKIRKSVFGDDRNSGWDWYRFLEERKNSFFSPTSKRNGEIRTTIHTRFSSSTAIPCTRPFIFFGLRFFVHWVHHLLYLFWSARSVWWQTTHELRACASALKLYGELWAATHILIRLNGSLHSWKTCYDRVSFSRFSHFWFFISSWNLFLISQVDVCIFICVYSFSSIALVLWDLCCCCFRWFLFLLVRYTGAATQWISDMKRWYFAPVHSYFSFHIDCSLSLSISVSRSLFHTLSRHIRNVSDFYKYAHSSGWFFFRSRSLPFGCCFCSRRSLSRSRVLVSCILPGHHLFFSLHHAVVVFLSFFYAIFRDVLVSRACQHRLYADMSEATVTTMTNDDNWQPDDILFCLFNKQKQCAISESSSSWSSSSSSTIPAMKSVEFVSESSCSTSATNTHLQLSLPSPRND